MQNSASCFYLVLWFVCYFQLFFEMLFCVCFRIYLWVWDTSVFFILVRYPIFAVNPPIEELQYFLDFQIPRFWVPLQNNMPGHQRKEPVCSSLQFSLMGPKLFVNSEQVSLVTERSAQRFFIFYFYIYLGYRVNIAWGPVERILNMYIPVGLFQFFCCMPFVWKYSAWLSM